MNERENRFREQHERERVNVRELFVRVERERTVCDSRTRELFVRAERENVRELLVRAEREN